MYIYICVHTVYVCDVFKYIYVIVLCMCDMCVPGVCVYAWYVCSCVYSVLKRMCVCCPLYVILSRNVEDIFINFLIDIFHKVFSHEKSLQKAWAEVESL